MSCFCRGAADDLAAGGVGQQDAAETQQVERAEAVAVFAGQGLCAGVVEAAACVAVQAGQALVLACGVFVVAVGRDHCKTAGESAFGIFGTVRAGVGTRTGAIRHVLIGFTTTATISVEAVFAFAEVAPRSVTQIVGHFFDGLRAIAAINIHHVDATAACGVGVVGIGLRAAVSVLAVVAALVAVSAVGIDLSNLALVGLVILLISPSVIFSASFQLSFAATAALLYGYQLTDGRIGEVPVLRHILFLSFSSALITFTTMPFVIWHFASFSP